MQAKAESATLLNNCTLSEISNMCLKLHFRQLVKSIQKGVSDYHDKSYSFPLSANEWINANLRGEGLHCSAVQPILEIFGCTLTSEGTHSCTEDWWKKISDLALDFFTDTDWNS